MGRWARFVDWVDSRIDKPADPSVLMGDRNPGSENVIEAEGTDQKQAAARGVRRARDRRRWRGGP